MTLLRLDTGEEFAAGRCRFLDRDLSHSEPTAKIFVPISLAGARTIAQVDTGAPWCLLNRDWADSLGLFDGSGEEIEVRFHSGRIKGRLERVVIGLPAESGMSLDVEATVLADPNWNGPNFLGWIGFLERLRIAIDPLPGNNFFYFGAASA